MCPSPLPLICGGKGSSDWELPDEEVELIDLKRWNMGTVTKLTFPSLMHPSCPYVPLRTDNMSDPDGV
jgi:hypothetical protein